MSLVLKNIGIGVESAWASAASPSSYPRVKSINLNVSHNKKLVDDTAGTRKGFGRIVNIGHEVEGDISAYAYSDDLGWWLKGIFGAVSSQALASGYKHTFNQVDSDVDLPSFTIVGDRGIEVNRWYGARFNTLKLNASNDIVEATVGLMASDEDTTSAYTVDSDQSLDPFVFHQVSIQLGDTLAAASGADEVPVDSWEWNFNNQMEKRFQSGSAGASRIDPKIAMCNGNFTKFYEDTDFRTWFAAGTEKAMIITITGGAIGATNHKLVLRIPRLEIMTAERPYEAGNLIVESASWEAMYDTNYGYMVQAELTNLKEDYTS